MTHGQKTCLRIGQKHSLVDSVSQCNYAQPQLSNTQVANNYTPLNTKECVKAYQGVKGKEKKCNEKKIIILFRLKENTYSHCGVNGCMEYPKNTTSLL